MEDGRFETLNECPLCGGTEFKEFCAHTGDPYLNTYDPALAERKVQWWVCMGCALVFQSPRLKREAMDAFYASGYRQSEPKENVINGKFQDAAFVVDFIKANWTPEKGGGKCLDIGCGEGCMVKTLAAVHKAGGPKWDSYGVEPNEMYARFAREKLLVQVATETFSDKSWRGLDFRLITISHTIEHMHDFKGFLREVKKRLRPEGRLYIGTPAVELPWGESWARPTDTVFETFGATHLQLFSSRTLTRTLNECGFWVDTLDHYIRGTLCLARHADDGEVNELAGKDDPGILVANVKRGHELWHQYINDPKHRHPFVQAEQGLLGDEASGSASGPAASVSVTVEGGKGNVQV